MLSLTRPIEHVSCNHSTVLRPPRVYVTQIIPSFHNSLLLIEYNNILWTRPTETSQPHNAQSIHKHMLNSSVLVSMKSGADEFEYENDTNCKNSEVLLLH